MRRIIRPNGLGASLAAACALLALAGCGGGGSSTGSTAAGTTVTDGTTGTTARTTGATETTAPETSTTAQKPIPRPPPPARTGPGPHGPSYFETPTHNIGCSVSAGGARCDIRERSWSPPPEPRSCKDVGVDWGQGIAIADRGASFVCAGDTVLGGKAVLRYREFSRRGDITCASRVIGVFCFNRSTRHGFFMSRQRYRLF